MNTHAPSFPALPTDPPAVEGVDPNVPSIARTYDFYLGGTNNYPVDRKVAQSVIEAFPEAKTLPLENRALLRRAVRFLAREHGIRQFLDIGSGLPTVENTHEVAMKTVEGVGGDCGEIRCVYVDIDPVVKAQSEPILAEVRSRSGGGGMRVEAVTGDATKMKEEILGQDEVVRTIDFGRPVAVLCLALFHFFEDAVVRRVWRDLADGLVEGSFVVVTHLSAEGVERVAELYRQQGIQMFVRSKEELAALLVDARDWAVVEPGAVMLKDWRIEELLPSDGNVVATDFGYALVVQKVKRA